MPRRAKRITDLPRPRTKDKRPSSHKRGYDSQWAKVRLAYLEAQPLCERCKDKGLTVVAVHVHHKRKLRDSPELKGEWSNLQALCPSCHSRLTSRGE